MEQHQQDTKKSKKGFVALVSVVVLSVVAVIVITSSFSSSTTVLVNLRSVQSGLKAKTNADSCVEIAINKLKTNTSYVGNESVTMDCGNCTISTISGTGRSNRAFTTTGVCNNSTRRMSVSITTVNPTTVINFWNEIP